MSEERRYKSITNASLEGDLLIAIRIQYVKRIAKEFVINNIVSKQYLDNLLKIKALKQNKPIENIYNDDNRIELLENILQKECAKGTARIINELCN